MASISLAGNIRDPDGSPLGAAQIKFHATRTSDTVVEGTSATVTTDYNGNYQVSVEHGTYAVYVRAETARDWTRLAEGLSIDSDTTEDNLNALVRAHIAETEETAPEVVLEIRTLRNETIRARDRAREWATSEVVVEDGLYGARYYAQVAQNAGLPENAMVHRGNWDASTGEFPSVPAIGHHYAVTTGGTVDGTEFRFDDRIIWNGEEWIHLKGFQWAVATVAGHTGDVTEGQLLEAVKEVDGPESGLSVQFLGGKDLASIEQEYQDRADAAADQALIDANAYTDGEVAKVTYNEEQFLQRILDVDGPESGIVAQYLGSRSESDIIGYIDDEIDNAAQGANAYTDSKTSPKLNKSEYTGEIILGKLLTVDGGGSGLDVQYLNGKERSEIESDYRAAAQSALSDANNYTDDRINALNFEYTGEEILALLAPVDGNGSGLDAEYLGGKTLATLESEYHQAVSDGVASIEATVNDYTDSRLDEMITPIVGDDPGGLNSLTRIAQALDYDATFHVTFANMVGAKLDATDFTAANILSELSNSAGAGSGLNADMLHGKQLPDIEEDYQEAAHQAEVAAKGYTDQEIATLSAQAGIGMSVQDDFDDIGDTLVVDVTQTEAFVVYNDRPITVELTGSNTLGRGLRVQMLVMNNAGIQFDNDIRWPGGEENVTLNPNWTMVNLTFFPTHGWFGAVENANVSNENLNPPTDINLSSLSLDERTLGAEVGYLTAEDEDHNSHLFTVDDERFMVDENSLLRLRDDRVVYYEEHPLQVRITAEDGDGLTFTKEFSLQIAELPAQEAYNTGRTPWAVMNFEATEIRAVDFDTGGQGIGYHDTTDAQQGDSGYRDSSVDFIGTGQAAVVGYIENGEWLEYTIRVETAAPYTFNLELSSTTNIGSVEVSAAKDYVVYVEDEAEVPNTGDASAYEQVPVTLDLEEGEQIVRVTFGPGLERFRTLSIERYVDPANPAPTDITLSDYTLMENEPGAVVGTVLVEDSDDDVYLYRVENDSRFEVDGELLKLKDDQEVDYTDAATIDVDLTVMDSGGNKLTRALTVEVQHEPRTGPPPAPEADNLLADAYLHDLDSTAWDNVSGQSSVEYGFADSRGDFFATEVTFIGDDNNHVYQDLGEPLAEGATYAASAEVRPGDTGFTGGFQLAYYDGGNELNGIEPSLEEGWQTIAFAFVANPAPEEDTSLRIIGWGNGSDGETLRIGKVELRKLADPLEGNLLDTDFITPDSVWNNASSGSVLTYGHADENGDPLAARVEVIGSSHHIWHDLSSPLTEGNTYRVTVEAAPGDTGYAGDFQIAYYEDGSNLESTSQALEDGWQTLTYEFTAPAGTGVEPSLRLIGFGNGEVGESVLIRQVSLIDITDE